MGKMKIAYVVATPDLKIDGKVTALQGELRGSFRRLREQGFDGAELMVGDPQCLDRPLLRSLSREYDLEIPALCTGEIYGQHGLSFTDPDGAVRDASLRRAFQVIDMAEEYGALVNIGRLRGRLHPAIPREQSFHWMLDAFQRIADHAAKRSVSLILEPVAYPFWDNLNTARAALEMIRKVDRKNFRLMLDVFSMNLEEKSLEEAFEESREHLLHVHLSDSNRLAPGMGNLDFGGIMTMLRNIAYDRWVSVEILQVPNGERALAQSARVLMPLVRES